MSFPMMGLKNIIAVKRTLAFITPLLIPFLWYWSYSSSRIAHFERNGTITNPTLKVCLPTIALLLSISVAVILSVGNLENIRKRVSNVHISTFFPVATSLVFVILPYFLAARSFTHFADLYFAAFRVSNLSPVFADMRTVLYGISCETVNDVGDIITCDPRNSQTLWNYPTVLLKFRQFGLGIDNLNVITFLAVFVFALAVFFHSRTLNQSSRLVFALLIMSPPVLLAFQRLNFDFVIISLLVIGSILVSWRNPTFINDILGVLCFACATLLKFYSFPALIILTLYLYGRKSSFCFALFVNSSTFFLIYPDLDKLAMYVGRDLRGALGLPVLIGLLNGSDDARFAIGTVGFFLALATISVYIFLICIFSETSNLKQYNYIILLSLSSAFLLPWITTSNYYYRNIFLVFIIPFLLTYHKNSQVVFISTIASASLFLSPVVFSLVMNLLLIPIISLLISHIVFGLAPKRITRL